MAAPARAAPGAASPSPPARTRSPPGSPAGGGAQPGFVRSGPAVGMGKGGGREPIPEPPRGQPRLPATFSAVFFWRRRHRARSGSSRSAFPNPCPDPRGLGGGDRAGERDGHIPNNSHLLSWQKVLEQKEDLKPVLSAFAERQLLLPRSGQDTLFSRSLSRGVKGTGCLPEGERRDLKPVMCDGGDGRTKEAIGKFSMEAAGGCPRSLPAPRLRGLGGVVHRQETASAFR